MASVSTDLFCIVLMDLYVPSVSVKAERFYASVLIRSFPSLQRSNKVPYLVFESQISPIGVGS